MIGLAGSHRTGKTTLARAYAQAYKIPLVETSSSEVFRELGYDPQADYPFHVRMFLQYKILENAERAYRKGGHIFITDRTPIDMMAYAMADVQRGNVDAAMSNAIMEYIIKCYEVTNAHFSMICVVQPGIPLVEDPTKAPANLAYMEHISALVKGMSNNEMLRVSKFIMKRNTLTLEDRLSTLHHVLVKYGQATREVNGAEVLN